MLLMLSVFLNALLAVLLYALDKYTAAKKLPYRAKQLLIGCLFGGLAAFSSEFGIPFQDIIINVREAMVRHGFRPLDTEWWHFTLEDEPYPDTYFEFPVSSDSILADQKN